MNDISFVKQQGGLGRPLPGQDFISGLIFFTPNGSLPSGFSTTGRIKAFFSIQDAESAGILANYSDETKAAGSYTVTNAGASANTVKLYFGEPEGKTVLIASYTKTASETTAIDVAAAIVALVNARSDVHGYVAVSGTATPAAATATATIATIGADGDSVELLSPGGISLGSFVKTSSETTTTLLAAALKTDINTNTGTTGYSATNTGAVITVTSSVDDGYSLNGTSMTAEVTGAATITPITTFTGGVSNITAVINITARPGLGIYPNTFPTLTAIYSASATLAGTIVQPSGGVASLQAVWHYHISEFFRLQPKGQLYVGFFAVPNTYTFEEIRLLQEFSGGIIRQASVYKDGQAYAQNDLTLIQSVASALEGRKMPLSVLYAADFSTIADISSLVTLANLTNPLVSVVISQDGAALGNALWYAYGKSITNIGALLGTVALSTVSDDVAWVGKYNITNGVENDTIAFANGVKFSDSSISESLLDSLNSKRFIFLRKFPDVPGSYWNDSHTAVSPSSDYAYIENNRTMHKAIRGIYKSMVPLIASPLVLNSDGTLTDNTVAYFESQAGLNLEQMLRDSELSAYSVTINPNQDVLATSTIVVTVALLPIGVARYIIINIGFTKSIS